jgi:hypothetical protein
MWGKGGLLLGQGRTVRRSALALAIITVIVTNDVWFIDVNGVSDCFAETMAVKNHDCGLYVLVWR